MIYYPLSVLMLAGIRDVLIISTPQDLPSFKLLMGDGSRFGIKLSYKEQPSPDGLAQAFIIGEDFIGDDDVCLVLGDNIFYGAGLRNILSNALMTVKQEKKTVVFANYVSDPERYGVVEFDEHKNVISIEEKPVNPKSNFAVVGLYFYPNSVIDIAKKITPSSRGELEITSVNEFYLQQRNIKMQILSRGSAWLDTGTHEALTEATEFVKAVEKRTGLKIACLEEIGLSMKWLKKEDIIKSIKGKKGEYYAYLAHIVK
jgi:glucose-1-phosphate thymidylyltransferase